MTLHFKKAPWKKLARRTREAAENVAGAAQAGAALVGQRAEETMACAKLRRTVKDLEEEIGLQMKNIGELIYATHCGTPSDSDDVQEILEYVDSLYEEKEGHERQLKAMKGVLFCQTCGAENEGSNVYCHNCGQPLSRV